MAKKLSRAVVHCDITNDPPIERGYEQPYDVVMCTLVMEGASTNCDEYCAHIAQLGKVVKPGGKVFYHGVENKVGYYTIGKKFSQIFTWTMSSRSVHLRELVSRILR